MGNLPRNCDVWSKKSRLAVFRIALEAGLPRGELRSISPGTAGTRGRVRVMRFERNSITPPLLKSSNLLDLPLIWYKLVNSVRSEGVDLDLGLHRFFYFNLL